MDVNKEKIDVDEKNKKFLKEIIMRKHKIQPT